MAYRVTHLKKNGDLERKRIDGDTESAYVLHYEGTRGVIVAQPRDRKVGYNFDKSMSKQVREGKIRDHLTELRKGYADTRGFSKRGTMKHVASIPPEFWWSEKAEKGPNALRDPKELKRFCQENDFCVSKW